MKKLLHNAFDFIGLGSQSFQLSEKNINTQKAKKLIRIRILLKLILWLIALFLISEFAAAARNIIFNNQF